MPQPEYRIECTWMDNTAHTLTVNGARSFSTYAEASQAAQLAVGHLHYVASARVITVTSEPVVDREPTYHEQWQQMLANYARWAA